MRCDLASVTLARFTPKVAASWKKKQLESGELSSSTVRKHLIFVGAAMNLAVAWRLIAENPLTYVELPDEEPPPFHVYAPSEQAALLSAAAPGDGDRRATTRVAARGRFVPVALDPATGLRRGELLGLRVTDVDLVRSRIHVRQALRKEEGQKWRHRGQSPPGRLIAQGYSSAASMKLTRCRSTMTRQARHRQRRRRRCRQ